MSQYIDTRTFIAISLSKQQTNLLVGLQQHLRDHIDADAVAVNKQNLHLTTAFLGPTTDKQIHKIDQFIQQQKFSVFEQTINKYAWWPAAQVTCIEGKPTAEIAKIASSLKHMASQLGLYQSQHVFRPHVSLYRTVNKVSNAFDDLLIPIEPICIKANELTLYESINSSQGVTYKPLQSWTLRHK